MPQDLDRLQGSWIVTALEMDGTKMPPAILGEARIVIKGNRFTSSGMGAEYQGIVKLDPGATPPQLDLKFDAGPEKGNTNLGIYKLGRDTWKMCLATRGNVRPSRFASIPGSGIAVQTLAREAAPSRRKAKAEPVQSKPVQSKDVTEFEGDWQMISGVFDGQAMDQSAAQWVKRVTRGNQTIVYAGPQVMMKFDFHADALKSPKAIDYVNMAGANKGKAQLGIYEFDQERLTVCVAAPGAARPERFESVKGKGATLTVWKRV